MAADFDDDEPTPIQPPPERSALKAELWKRKPEAERDMAVAVARDLREELARVTTENKRLWKRIENMAAEMLRLKKARK